MVFPCRIEPLKTKLAHIELMKQFNNLFSSLTGIIIQLFQGSWENEFSKYNQKYEIPEITVKKCNIGVMELL